MHKMVKSLNLFLFQIDPEAVERKRKKQEEVEKQTMTTSVSGGGGLKVCGNSVICVN